MSEKKTSDSVDQIRDILFGEQVKQFEQQIQTLQKSMSKHVAALEQKISALNEQNQKSFKELKEQHKSGSTQMMQEHQSALENLQTSLSNRIIDTESSVLTELQKKIDALDDKATHRKELAQLLKKMSDQLQD